MSNIQKKNVLHVNHSWGGGIPIYVSDLQGILNDSYNIYVLKCADSKIILEYPESDNKLITYNLPREMGLLEITNSGVSSP